MDHELWQHDVDAYGNAILPEPDHWDPEPDTEVAQPAETTNGIHPFWGARETLQTIHDFAKARMVSPPAVLAGVLVGVVAATPHDVVLPPIIGSMASLNLSVGFVGESGSGKGASESVARECVLLGGGMPFERTSVISGPGFTYIFADRRKADRNDGGGMETVRTAYNALVSIPEIDMLAGFKAQTGSTIMPTLRSVAMGEMLGGHASTEEKRVKVLPLSYRCCVTVGVQPARSAVLFRDADGGTPQRFLFVSVTDPHAERNPPEAPEPLVWIPPAWDWAESQMYAGQQHRVMRVPDVAVEATKTIRWERNTGKGDPMDGHRNLLRLKVSAALGILEGRTSITEEDWYLADVFLKHSDAQRERCMKALNETLRVERRAVGVGEAHAEIAKAEALEHALVPEVKRKILVAIKAAGEPGLAVGMIAKKLSKAQREHVTAALEALVRDERIVQYRAVSGSNGAEVIRYTAR